MLNPRIFWEKSYFTAYENVFYFGDLAQLLLQIVFSFVIITMKSLF